MEGTVDFKGCITHGPWGGSQGKEWVYKPEGFIRKIIVKYGDVVDFIEFQTHCSKGEIQSSCFGVNYNIKSDTISINYPLEYLVSISGTFGEYHKSGIVVKSICFKTNVTSYGPYGTNSGAAFSYEGEGGKIIGFHGRDDKYLNAIGVYVIPESLATAPSSTHDCKNMPELCSSMAMPREVGPWGAVRGKPWDDGVFSTIKRVCVHVGELNVIYAPQFEYLKKDGKSVLSQIHGGIDGVENIHVVNLDDNDEFFIGISGFYGPVKGYGGLEAIRSISFHTNKRIHGPYGEERGAGSIYYSSTASPGKIVGFHGRDIGFLSAIGVHMEYF